MTIQNPPHMLTALSECSNGERIVTIGTFDGVHLGHRSLIDRAVARSRALGLLAMAITFEPVPASVLRPDLFAGRVCSAADKMNHLRSTGLDEIVTLQFDRRFAEQTPDEFMAAVSDATRLRELWVGEAFALGRNRAGNVDRLTEIGNEFGFSVNAVQRLTNGDRVISSSAVRTAVLAGDVAQAARALGRPFRISGEVIHGAQLGRTIGYPTANVLPPPDLVPLADGIYVSLTTIPGEAAARPSMTYVGTRPTVNSGVRLVETHLLDFDGDLYGKVIDVDLLEHLRGDATFAGVDALISQLNADEAATRAYLASRPSN